MATHAVFQLLYAIFYIVLYFALSDPIEKYFTPPHPIAILYSPVLPILLGANLAQASFICFA